MTLLRNTAATLMAAGFLILSAPVLAQHGGGGGDVDNSALPDIPEGKWLSENPYRGSKQAMEIGKNAYDGNCARCHGIDMISGGIAPDLRELGPEYDEYFLGHIRNGVQRNGMTYMPAFEEVLDQETMWAIRSYIDKRHYEYKDKNLDDLYKQWDEKQAAGGDQPATEDTDSTSANTSSSAAPAQGATASVAAGDASASVKKKENASADAAVEDSTSATVADASSEDADRLQLIKSVGSIEIAMYRAFPPWSYQAEDGSFTGIDVEIGKALARQLGVSLKARPFTPDEGMGDDIRNQVWKGHYLGGKPADAMIHVGMAPAFQKDNDQATFVAPYYDETMGFAYNAEQLGGDVDNPLALAGKKIGVQLDSLGDYFLSSAYQGQLRDGVEHFNSVPEAMKAMNAGEVVAVMAPIGELKGAAKMLGESRMKMRTTKLTGLYQTSWDVGVAVKEGNPELAAAIKDAMHALRESGELKKIFEQFGVPYRKPMQEDNMTAGL